MKMVGNAPYKIENQLQSKEVSDQGLQNLFTQINELKDKDSGGANDAIENVFDANGALSETLQNSLKNFSLEDLNTIKTELGKILQDDSLGLSEEVKSSVNKLIGIFDSIINEKSGTSSTEQVEKSEAEQELDSIFVDNKASTLQSIYKTYATTQGTDWNGEDIVAVPQSVFDETGKGKKFNAEQFKDRFNTKNKERIEGAKTKGEEIIKNASIDGITYDAESGKFKKGDADFDVKDLLLEGDGVKEGLSDFVINKDELSKDWFKDTISHWETALKGRFETPTEGSGEWEDVTNMEDGLEGKLGDLGENKFLENKDGKVVYNFEKVKSFLGMINQENFNQYWSLDRSGGRYTVVGTANWKAINSAVQILLNKEHGGNLKVDGKWVKGRAMWKAIQDFQKEKKLSNTNGQLNFETIQALGVGGNGGAESSAETSESSEETSTTSETPASSSETPASPRGKTGRRRGRRESPSKEAPTAKPRPSKPVEQPGVVFENMIMKDPDNVLRFGLKPARCPNGDRINYGIPDGRVYMFGNDNNSYYYKISEYHFMKVSKTKPYFRTNITFSNMVDGVNYHSQTLNDVINVCPAGKEELDKKAKLMDTPEVGYMLVKFKHSVSIAGNKYVYKVDTVSESGNIGSERGKQTIISSRSLPISEISQINKIISGKGFELFGK